MSERFSYKKSIYNKLLPEKWHKLYRYRYGKYTRLYRKKIEANPIIEVILERVVYISVFLLFVESGEYKDFAANSPFYVEDYTNVTAQLSRQLDMFLRQLDTKLELLEEQTEDKPVEEMSDEEIERELREIEEAEASKEGAEEETEEAETD